jgi:hypothetical protein
MQEALVLPFDGKKKGIRESERLHTQLMRNIQAGEPIEVDGAWPNGRVVILRNDVLGRGNHHRFGMLLVRRSGERLAMLTVNWKHHDARKARAFLWGEAAGE